MSTENQMNRLNITKKRKRSVNSNNNNNKLNSWMYRCIKKLHLKQTTPSIKKESENTRMNVRKGRKSFYFHRVSNQYIVLCLFNKTHKNILFSQAPLLLTDYWNVIWSSIKHLYLSPYSLLYRASVTFTKKHTQTKTLKDFKRTIQSIVTVMAQLAYFF